MTTPAWTWTRSSGDPTQQIANCLSSPGSGSGPGQQPTGLYPVVERSGQHNGSSLHQAPINQAQPRRGIPTPQQTSATPQSNLTQISSRVSVNGLPPNGVLAQINSVPPQQSPQFTPPLSQQPIEPNGLSRILTPPDTLHPTLSCWIKNMNKLSSLIDRLQELASAASAEHRSQLLRQVVALRTTFKKQQEHCMEFLTLSDEYANKYLLDISDEIQRQSSFLDKLEERLETAKKLRREAVDLQILYESGTVATMKNFRATALPRPLPEDDALFSEVDLVLTEIRQCYMELDKFWTEEISRAIEALKMRRVDPTDFERWKSFHVNLKQTIESWKNELPSGGAQIPPCNNTSSSKDADIGAIASSMSSVMGSLTSALECVTSSNSLKYLPSGTAIGRSSMQRVYVAFVSNNDLCFSFLQKCADYGEKAIGWRLPPIASPTSLRVMASHDLRERTMRCMRLRSKMTHVSVENAASVQGSRKFTAAYNKALSLEKKTTSGLNILIEKISSWVVVTDGHGLSDDVHPDVISLEQVRELWEKAGYSVRAALAILKNEPAPQLLLPSAPLASTRLRSVMKRWMTKLVCFL
ncbi:hypothetical protein DFH94DRAFT_166762 [Russula ochroleuca]|uniref:Uncharacterized protein n=1 Tax=Russula ochroleuca TaxID=152965 RepID=A0A9P5N4A5_9AGAM|nr:hypothetical protein DFH94DRAFT_166762 [Russula ochroleuca]